MIDYTKEELVELLRKFPEKFNEWKLEQEEVDLSEVDFSGITLREVDFSNADLNSSSFADCTLSFVNFTNTDLTSGTYRNIRCHLRTSYKARSRSLLPPFLCPCTLYQIRR